MEVECDCTNKKIVVQLKNAYKQVLWGALGVGQQKKRELATTSLEFDYLHQKSQIIMQTADWQDDISNDVIIPWVHAFTCFSFFLYIHSNFSIALIGGNLKGQLP